MKRYLFLDDIRHPKHTFMSYMYGRDMDASIYPKNDWDVVRNYDEFVTWVMTNGVPDVVSFDHDLADEHYAPYDVKDIYDEWSSTQNFKENTGLDCVKWLVEYCHENNVPFPVYYVHSANPVGAENMSSYIKSAVKSNYITETLI